MHALSRAQCKSCLENVRLQKCCPWSSLKPTPNISQSFHLSSSHCKTKTSRNQLHLGERFTPSPPGFVGSLPLWLHHRHLPALQSKMEGSFLVVAFATTSAQTIQTRATEVVGCQNCCQRLCQHSDAIQERDLLADMVTPTKHHSINCVKKSKSWGCFSSEKGKWREWWVLMG